MSNSGNIEEKIVRLCPGRQEFAPLSPRQVAEGMNACYQNAASLLKDSRLLASQGRVARALALVVLTLEEMGKIPELYTMAFQGESEDWKKFWDRFIRHRPKQEKIASYFTTMQAIGKKSPYALSLSEPVLDHLDRLKQRAFYTDYVGQAFQTPQVLESEAADCLDYLFAAAEERLDSFAQMHETVEGSEAFIDVGAHLRNQILEAHSDEEQLALLRQGIPVSSRPLARSEGELRGRLRSLAAALTTDFVPDHWNFCDQCPEILQGHANSLVRGAITVECKYLYKRVHVHPLPTSARRSNSMLRLFLFYLHRTDSELLQEVSNECRLIAPPDESDEAGVI